MQTSSFEQISYDFLAGSLTVLSDSLKNMESAALKNGSSMDYIRGLNHARELVNTQLLMALKEKNSRARA